MKPSEMQHFNASPLGEMQLSHLLAPLAIAY